MSRLLTLSQFNLLTDPEKFGLLEDHGTYLEIDRLDRHCRVALFSLYDFYVEVWLNEITDEITQATGFNSARKLNIYLKEVDITEVYQWL